MRQLLRRLLILPYLAGFAAATLLAGMLWQDYVQEVRGIAMGEQLPVVAPYEPPALGINAALEYEDDGARQRSLQLLRAGGYTWVRQRFPWREIEPAKGVFSWERWDRLVQDYRRHGLRVIAVLDRPPDWTRVDNNWPNRPPDRPADFGDFVAAFAARYRGQVDHLQIWDEPNVFPNWGNRPVDPAGYAELLAVAHERAKQANPDGVVLLAGLAPNAETGGRNMSDLLFLDALYDSGAGPHFDVAAAKPYGLWYPPEDRALAPDRASYARVVLWREVMVARGDGGKPIWAVELGWNSLPAAWAGRPSSWGTVTPEAQADYTLAAVERARAEWPWLPVLVLQGYMPDTAGDDPRAGFSIVDPTGRPRPVYEALRAHSEQPIGTPVGFHAAASPLVELAGAWQQSSGTLAGAAPATLRMRFTGTRLDLQMERGPEGGAAIVTVDGLPANRLTKVGGRAWLDARSRRPSPERITVADALAPGAHELAITVVPRRDLWPRHADSPERLVVDGFFVVRDPDYSRLPWVALGPAAVAALLLWQSLVLIAAWPWLPAGRRIVAAGRALAIALGRLWGYLSYTLRGDRQVLLMLGFIAAAVAALYVAPAWAAPPAMALVVVAAYRRPVAVAFALVAAAPLRAVPVHLAAGEFAAAELLSVAAAAALGARWCVAAVAARWQAARDATGERSGAVEARAPGDNSLPALWRAYIRLQHWMMTGFNGPIAALVVAGLIATAFAQYPREALRELRTVFLEPLILYALVVGRYEGESPAAEARWVRRLVDALIVVGVAVAVVSLYQYFLTEDVITAEGVRRARAFYGSPNNLGLFLGRVIPVAICLACGHLHRRWYRVALVPLVAAAVLSYSVGAWTAIAIAALFVAVLHGRVLAIRAAAGFAATLAGVLAMAPVERVTSHLSLDQGTSRLRLLLWQGALDMARDHPWFGVGPDNFLQYYRSKYMLAEAWREPNLSHPHNLLLDFWLRGGLLGLLAGCWLLIRFFTVGLDLYRRLADRSQRLLVLGLLASMVDFVAHGLVDNSLFLVDLALVFWLSCGVLEVIRRGHYNTASGR